MFFQNGKNIPKSEIENIVYYPDWFNQQGIENAERGQKRQSTHSVGVTDFIHITAKHKPHKAPTRITFCDWQEAKIWNVQEKRNVTLKTNPLHSGNKGTDCGKHKWYGQH